MKGLKNRIKSFMLNSRFLLGFLTIIKKPFESKLRNKNRLQNNICNTCKVSVVIPNYNYSKYLKKRVDSILKQTYPVYELIFLDDKSTDNSVAVIESIISDLKIKNPSVKVQFLKNTKNSKKPMHQWAKGFDVAKGDYVWIAEIDDSSDEHFLAEAMAGFNDPQVVLSYTESAVVNKYGATIFDSYKRIADKAKTHHWDDNYINDGIHEIENYLYLNCTIPNVSGVVFKKTNRIPYQQYFKESQQFQQVGDWHFYIKVLTHGKIAFSSVSLNHFRLHQNSVTGKNNKENNHAREIIQIHDYIKQQFNITEEKRDKMIQEEQRVSARDII